MEPDRIARWVGVVVVALLITALGGSALAWLIVAAMGNMIVDNPRDLLYGAFFAGGVSCSLAAVVVLARTLPAWARSRDSVGWRPPLYGLTVVGLLWFVMFVGGLGLMSS